MFPDGLEAAGVDLLTVLRALRRAQPALPLSDAVEADIAAIAAAVSKKPAPAPARKTFALFALPRTGSTFIADKLAADGRFGRPREHFNPRVFRRVTAAADREISLMSYWRAVEAATASPDGVAGVKVQTYHHLYWRKKRRVDLLDLGFDRVYWLERADLDAGARSLALGIRTGDWHGVDPGNKPRISKVELRVARAALEAHKAHFFAHYGDRIDRTFVLEEWSARPDEVVETIAADLGLTGPADTPVPPSG
jgi:LPS sulfotransferase NodH